MFDLNYHKIYHNICLTGYLDQTDNEQQTPPPTTLVLLACSYCVIIKP